MPSIICTVTNDLNHDQRMQRICDTLARNGYTVTLVGRALPHSKPLLQKIYAQHRLHCHFQKGVLFYAEYNLRLGHYLLRASCDAICSVDLDSLPAGCMAALLRRKKRLFDAHEFFTEVPEVTGRPLVKWIWSALARCCLFFYRHAYTVGPALAQIFSTKYGIPFGVVRNMAVFTGETNLAPAPTAAPDSKKILLYQGALNEARGIEQLLEALPLLDDRFELWLAGEGDLSARLRQMAGTLGLGNRVRFLGMVSPDDLRALTRSAWLGLNVLENKGLSYYYSLANKFFDYVQAGVPALTMDFPEYRALNREYEVAVLLEQLSADAVVRAVKNLAENPSRHQQLRAAALEARKVWNWEQESRALLVCWAAVFQNRR